MSRLFDAYRAVHEQAFMPIFVADDFDSKMLVESCIEAGCTGIEYTLRRRDAHKMIPWIRETYPDLYLLVGSTLDDDRILEKQRRKHPQLVPISELDAMGVDGFVSMIGWHEESIREYCNRRLIMPTAMTVNEAFFQIGAGAHFAKLFGGDLAFVKRCRGAAAFGYCPIIVTGGVTTERMDEVMGAGAVLAATGFDLTLKGESADVDPKHVIEVTRAYLDAAQAAQRKAFPDLAAAAGAEPEAWLDALPHFHPF